MATDVQDGGKKAQNFGIVQHFCILMFAMSFFCQQQGSQTYFVELVKNYGGLQDGG
jgi:hypothetical protein